MPPGSELWLAGTKSRFDGVQCLGVFGRHQPDLDQLERADEAVTDPETLNARDCGVSPVMVEQSQRCGRVVRGLLKGSPLGPADDSATPAGRRRLSTLRGRHNVKGGAYTMVGWESLWACYMFCWSDNRGKAMAMVTTTRAGRKNGTAVVPHLSVAERVARGKAARDEVPRSSHATFEPLPTRLIRSSCCSVRRRRAYRSSCRSGTGGCWSRRSRSIAARR